MNALELLRYVQKRREYIGRNTTGDVFCASCLQATSKTEKSECCGKEVLSKEEALHRIPIIVEKLQERIYVSGRAD